MVRDVPDMKEPGWVGSHFGAPPVSGFRPGEGPLMGPLYGLWGKESFLSP